MSQLVALLNEEVRSLKQEIWEQPIQDDPENCYLFQRIGVVFLCWHVRVDFYKKNYFILLWENKTNFPVKIVKILEYLYDFNSVQRESGSTIVHQSVLRKKKNIRSTALKIRKQPFFTFRLETFSSRWKKKGVFPFFKGRGGEGEKEWHCVNTIGLLA